MVGSSDILFTCGQLFKKKKTADPYHNITVYGQTSIATNAFIYRKSNFEFVLKPPVVSTHNASLTCRTWSTTKMAGSQLWCLQDFPTSLKCLAQLIPAEKSYWVQLDIWIGPNWFQLDINGGRSSSWASWEVHLVAIRHHEKSSWTQLDITKAWYAKWSQLDPVGSHQMSNRVKQGSSK